MGGTHALRACLLWACVAACSNGAAPTETDARAGCESCSMDAAPSDEAGDSGDDVALRERSDVPLTQFWDVHEPDSAVALWDAGGVAPDVEAPAEGACDPRMVVDLRREGNRIGDSWRWSNRFDQSAVYSPLVPGRNCPPAMMFHRVFRYRVERPGDVAIWALRGAWVSPNQLVVGFIERCAEGESIVSCDQSVPNVEAGRELQFVVGVPIWSHTSSELTAEYTVALDDGLPTASLGGLCGHDHRRVAGCPSGAVCQWDSGGTQGFCARLGAPGGPCDGSRESACVGGVCAYGRCVPRVPELGSCLSAPCAEGLDCVEGVCRGRGRRDSPCRADDDPLGRCDAPLVCAEERCRRVAPPNHGCAIDACPLNTRCTPTPAGAVCVPEGIRGGPCRRGGASRRCDMGLSCSSQGICESSLPLGAPCVDELCADGGCVAGRCVQGQPPGARCDPSLPCTPPAACAAGLCRTTRRRGESCVAPGDLCAEGRCTAGRCVVDGFLHCNDDGLRCSSPSESCLAGYCRRAPIYSYCFGTSYICPAGAECSEQDRCEARRGAWCGRAGDPPCPAGSGCDYGQCVPVFPCVQKRYHLCAEGGHCSGGHSNLRCLTDGLENSRCRLSGRPCEPGLRCSARLRCERNPTWPSYTLPASQCVARLCPEGTTCDYLSCLPTRGEGARCEWDAHCAAPLRCQLSNGRGVCVPTGRRSGPCRLNSSTPCDPGLVCSYDRCEPPSARSAPCEPGVTVCAEGMSCAEREGEVYQCAPNGTEHGTSCRSDGRPCDPPYHCNRGRCEGPLSEGMVCRRGTWSERCADGLWCQGNLGSCRAPGRPGGICAASLTPCPPGFGCFATNDLSYTPMACFPAATEGQLNAAGRCADGLFAVPSLQGLICQRAGTSGAPCRFESRAPVCDAALSCDIRSWICR